MKSPNRTRAEEQFTATQKRDEQRLKDNEARQKMTSEKIDRLKALRLARDKADSESENPSKIEKSEAAKSSALPTFHRAR